MLTRLCCLIGWHEWTQHPHTRRLTCATCHHTR